MGGRVPPRPPYNLSTGYNALLLLAFQEYIIAVKEIKMLKLETLLTLVNIALFEYGPRRPKNRQSPI